MKNIVFVNTHGFGDVLHSRQGVRWVIDNLGDNYKYFYVSTLGIKPCYIHHKINYVNLPRQYFAHDMMQIKHGLRAHFNEDDLWIDVWAASYNQMLELPGFGFKLPDENGNYTPECAEIQDTTRWQVRLYKEKIQQINDFLLMNFSNKRLELPDHTEFVCKWNDNPPYKFFADKFIKETSKFRFRVILCNGNTTSNQRRNFIFEDILRDFIREHSDICFIFTSKISEIDLPNVFYIDDNFPNPNLDEIEYLMNFCQIVVTSQSGPGCLAFTDAVVYDENKTIILFCVDDIQWYFDGGSCTYIRTSNFEDSNVLEIISSNVLRYL